MTEKSISVVALVADNGTLTFYKTNGEVYTITQGDPRGGAMVDDFLAQQKLGKKIIELNLYEDDKIVIHLTDNKRNPLIRFFRAFKKDVVKLFGSEQYDNTLTEETHEAAAQKVRDIAAKLHSSSRTETINNDDLPIKLIQSEKPFQQDETIIAVTADGIVPGVENLNDQFQAGAEGCAPAEGPDNLILRLCKLSAKRGHTAKELMDFIKIIDLPILPDGSFLAYKRLHHIGRGVYVDPHTARVHQRIGDVVQMDENLVDPSKRITCSQGLHVGSRHYMGGFHSKRENSRTMLVLIQPEDAIAVPPHENKMRVCRYLILADLSNKAHDLVNANKRMDDCQETMQIVAQIVAGARPALLGVVNISKKYGEGLSYHIGKNSVPTDISLEEALHIANRKATAPVTQVKEVRTIDDTKNGNQTAFVPQKVYDKAHVVKPVAIAAKATKLIKPIRVQVAAQFYGRMTDTENTNADRREAALGLKAHKQRAKVSYSTLELPANTADEIETILVATEPKAEPVKAFTGGTRQDRARALWDNLSNTKLTDNQRKQAAQELRNFKSKAKVGWNTLGLGKYNVEAELKKVLN